MKLSLSMLKQKGACEEAVRAFEALALPNDETGEIDWTPAAQGWILADSKWRRWLGVGHHYGIIPLWSMSGADLSNADLRRVDLSNADLSGADLSNADLIDANLSCANLSDADLSGADLIDANLSCANLRRADLRRADLRRANLRRADLEKTIYDDYTIWPLGYRDYLAKLLESDDEPPAGGVASKSEFVGPWHPQYEEDPSRTLFDKLASMDDQFALADWNKLTYIPGNLLIIPASPRGLRIDGDDVTFAPDADPADVVARCEAVGEGEQLTNIFNKAAYGGD